MAELRYENIGDYFYPQLPLKLKYGSNEVEVFGLLDSGALRSLFNFGIAASLGLDVESGIKETIQGINGKINIFAHELEIEAAGKKFKTKIAFSKEFTSSFNIIGRLGFFEHFVITFDDENKIFYIN